MYHLIYQQCESLRKPLSKSKARMFCWSVLAWQVPAKSKASIQCSGCWLAAGSQANWLKVVDFDKQRYSTWHSSAKCSNVIGLLEGTGALIAQHRLQ